MKAVRRVILLGLDGGTWDIITPLVQDGRLPTFKHLMENGAWARMPSTIPPGTPSGWGAIMTGVSPGKHGYFNFTKVNRDYSVSLCLSDSLRAKAIWDYMDDAGRRSLLLNLPISYPPQRINGVVVSGMQTPGLHSEFTYPPELKQYVLQNLPDYVIDLEFRIYGQGQRFLSALRHAAERRFQLFERLISEGSFDFMSLVVTETDRLQHLWWNEKAVSEFYSFLDTKIAHLLQTCENQDTMLVLASDHGFAEIQRQFSLNSFLKQKGYLEYRRSGQNLVTTLRYALHDLGLDSLVNSIPVRLRTRLKERFMETDAQKAERIDWQSTLAFSLTSFCEIMLNSESRFDGGVVTDDNMHRVKTELIRDLLGWRDPDTGHSPLTAVYDADELYADAPYAREFADIVVLPAMDKGYAATPHYQDRPIVPAHRATGNHDVMGIFLAYGDTVAPAGNVGTVTMYDVAPTILHALGIAIPSNIDGRVLSELFVDGSEPATRPVAWQDKTEKERLRRRARKLRLRNDI